MGKFEKDIDIYRAGDYIFDCLRRLSLDTGTSCLSTGFPALDDALAGRLRGGRLNGK
ncbi:MAG: elongator complex protein 4 [Endomicrobium sp.]|jgi:hypothetical protein|nr:elongator complex protein 4 [Endomicrobium sp.]